MGLVVVDEAEVCELVVDEGFRRLGGEVMGFDLPSTGDVAALFFDPGGPLSSPDVGDVACCDLVSVVELDLRDGGLLLPSAWELMDRDHRLPGG